MLSCASMMPGRAPPWHSPSRSLERIMRSRWRSGLIACLVVPVIAIVAVPLRAVAQPNDVAAAQKRFQDLYAAGDYSAALAEAQKNEAAAKRGGTNNFAYVSALNDLARAHQALGHYGEAAGMFKQVLGTLQKNSRRPIPAWPSRSPTWPRFICCRPIPARPRNCTSRRSRSRPRRRADPIRTSRCSSAISPTSTRPRRATTRRRHSTSARSTWRRRPPARRACWWR